MKRETKGQKDSSLPSVKSPQQPKPPFFLAKKGKHKKKIFFFIRFSLCTSADRFKTNTKHTHKREEEREKEKG